MAELVGVVGPFVAVMCINALLLLTQVSMSTINTDFTTVETNNMVCNGGIGSCTNYSINNNYQSSLTSQSVSGTAVSGGSAFTDLWRTVSSFFTGVLGFVWGMVSAPAFILGHLGMPSVFGYVIGAIWYGYSLLVIVMFFRGG